MTAIKAVLFDWGETLVHVPGMGHRSKPSARPAEADVELSDLRQLTAWCDLPSEARRRA